MRRYVAAIARRVEATAARAAAGRATAQRGDDRPARAGDRRRSFPHYEALRRKDRCCSCPGTTIGSCSGTKRSGRAFARPEHFSNAPYRDVDAVLLAADPPEQTAMRRTVAKLFSPAVTARLEETASRLADALVRPELDVVSGYGIPVSRGVTADLLGLDAAGVEDVVAAEARSLGTPDPLADFIVSLDAMAHRSSMFEVLMGADVPEESARSLVRLMWLAGTTTTQRVISRAVLRAIEDESDQRALRDDPALVRPFVEEVLRLHPPEHMVPRLARRMPSWTGS